MGAQRGAKTGWDDRLRGRAQSSASNRGAGHQSAAPSFRAGSTTGSAQFTGQRSNQVVVKVASHSKTVRGVKNMIQYISEHAGEKERGVYTEDGKHLTGADGEGSVDNWNLTPDADNLSAAGERARDEGRLSDLDDSEKHQHRQGIHFIVSLPVTHREVTDEQLTKIGKDTIAPFIDEGHSAVYASHRHQAQPHIHVVMSYKGNDGPFRTNKETLQALREHTAEVLKTHGIDARADRSPKRGPAQEKHQNIDNRSNEAAGLPRLGKLRERAPLYYARYGVDYERLRADRAGAEPAISERVPTTTAKMGPLHPGTTDALEKWSSAFKDPQNARQRFLEIAAENHGLAFWVSKNNPELFGATERTPDSITAKDVRLSAPWRKETLASIRDAEAQTPVAVRSARKSQAEDAAIATEQKPHRRTAQTDPAEIRPENTDGFMSRVQRFWKRPTSAPQSRPETPQEAGKAYQAGKGAKPHPGAAQTAQTAGKSATEIYNDLQKGRSAPDQTQTHTKGRSR